MRGVEVLCEVLRSEGVTHLFGNPGTTELPLVTELAAQTDLQYVLGLQESTVVAMADGYARITRRPAFVNLHAAAGLGAAIGNLTNAVAHRAPIVVSAGNADQRHAAAEPLLSADLVGMAAGFAKWRHEVRSASELGLMARRAFRLAATPPLGPVFLSLPTDVLEGEADGGTPRRSDPPAPSLAGGLDAAAACLIGAGERIAIVAGDPVAHAGALDAIEALAEALGSPVFGSPFYGRQVFRTGHPLWRGMLPSTAGGVRAALEPFQAVLLVDEQAFLAYNFSPDGAIPPHVQLLHLSPDPAQIGRMHPVAIGMCGDVKVSLERLVEIVRDTTRPDRAARRIEEAREERANADARLASRIAERSTSAPMHAMAASHALIDGIPRGSIVVDEAITTGAYLRGLHRPEHADGYWFCRGGGLGWGMPAAAGLSLGAGREPVLAVIGDGSAMYAPQALWTAARERLPVVFAIVDNGRYAILEQSVRAAGHDGAVGLDLGDPALDFVALGMSMGVPGARVTAVDQIRSALAENWGRSGPFLLHIPIA